MTFFYSFIYGCGNYVVVVQASVKPGSSTHYKMF